MTLSEAFQVLATRPEQTGSPASIGLYCGFEPLHLNTFLAASSRQRRPGDVAVKPGPYGNLTQSILQAAAEPPDSAAVIVEWPDLDPRLGWRSAARWDQETARQILRECRRAAARLRGAITALSAHCTVAMSGPTLPLPKLDHTTPAHCGSIEVELEHIVTLFLQDAGRLPNVRIVRRHEIDRFSAPHSRFDIKMELHAGCPYTTSHAGVMGELLAKLLFPASPKKGLITDLDGVLWRGIVGEAGPAGICWTLDGAAQYHALYQRELAMLAAQGVLLAVASKNDQTVAQQGLARDDLVVAGSSFFPVEANWGPKSESVRRILEAWNIGQDSVVFVDDSPMELAEVGEAFPELLCLPFPTDDPSGVLDLIHRLRELFGKPAVFEEDRIRGASLRTAMKSGARSDEDREKFTQSLGGRIQYDIFDPSNDRRAFELLNKTNQFNLNGRRFSDAEWREYFAQPGALGVSVSYEDRFGPLGKIGTLLLRVEDDRQLVVDAWVMSCRAFSRRIEHHTLQWLLQHFDAPKAAFRYRETPRNGPLAEFFRALGVEPGNAGYAIDRATLSVPPSFLPHQSTTKQSSRVQLA